MSLLRAARSGQHHHGRLSPATYSIVKLVAASLLHLPLSFALPFSQKSVIHNYEEDLPKSPEDASLWVYLGTAIALVLLGGAFAGLTIALMGQDEIYLQVIAKSGEGKEKKDAKKVLKLLKRGKHWVLVTLLLSNVITNETLPIVLDRSLGGGWPAVVSSTVLIVIFGEIAPQSVCVRYGLTIGAWMAPFVLGLMWIMAPVAWPTAKLLDWLLGEDHGTTYKKAGLKTLVTLHKSLGTSPTERLNQDEVTIISAVLDLKEKAVGDIMTPMDDVFTMSADTVLNEEMMDTILSQGYSRIPIYAPENPNNFIGMLLVKILITYDPEDCLRVRDFALATLPETAPETSCLDIVNFFQEGKSHMVLVSEHPGQDRGAIGVLTLEDVIEELIGEEIIDESDVFIDVHRAIRRMAPAPRMKYNKPAHPKEQSVVESEVEASDAERANGGGPHSRKTSLNVTDQQRGTTFLLRRKSSGADGSIHGGPPTTVRGNSADMKQHLKHLGPSNAASKPKATKYTSVKIKPGVGTIPEMSKLQVESSPARDPSVERANALNALNGNAEGSSKTNVILFSDTQSDTTRETPVVSQGYGTNDFNPPITIENEADLHVDARSPPPAQTAAEASEQARQNAASHASQRSGESDKKWGLAVPDSPSRPGSSGGRRSSEDSDSTIGELGSSRRPSSNRRAARSGSITESTVHVGGMKKIVLETHSSASDDENADGAGNGDESHKHDRTESQSGHRRNGSSKHRGSSTKNKRGGKNKRTKSGHQSGSGSTETSPLLAGGQK